MSWNHIEAAFQDTDIGVMMISLDSMRTYFSTRAKSLNVAIVVSHGHAYMVEAREDTAPINYNEQFMDCPSLTCMPQHLHHHKQKSPCGACRYRQETHIHSINYINQMKAIGIKTEDQRSCVHKIISHDGAIIKAGVTR